MFEHTKRAIDKVKKDLEVLSWIFKYGVSFLMIAYYIMALIIPLGNMIANIVFLVITSVFLVFNAFYDGKKLSKKEKKQKRDTKRVIKAVRLLTSAYSLAATIYAMYSATTAVDPISIILTTILLAIWAISVLIELVCFIISLEISYRL